MAKKEDSPPAKPKNWRLYHLLDVKPPVSSMAIKYTSSRATLRTQFHQAYWALAETNRKFFYDIGGESAFDFLCSNTWGALVSFFGLRLFAFLYFLVMLILVVLLGVFFILLGLRADDVIDNSWQNVTIPLLIFFAIVLIIAFVGAVTSWPSFLSSALPHRASTVWDRLAPLGMVFAALGYFISAILLFTCISSPNHAQSNIGTYMYYFIPLLLADTVYYLTSFTWRVPSVVKRKMKLMGEDPPSRLVYTGIPVMGGLHWLCCLAQWILLGLRLDNTITCVWYVVAIPFALRLVFRIIDAGLRSFMRRRQRVRGSLGMAFDIVGALFLNGSLIISIYWSAVWLEELIFIVSLSVALIPVYIVLLYLLVGLVLTFILTECTLSDLEAQETRMQFMWTPSEKEGGAVEWEWNEEEEERNPSHHVSREKQKPQSNARSEGKESSAAGRSSKSESTTRNLPSVSTLTRTTEESSLFPTHLEATTNEPTEPYDGRGNRLPGPSQALYAAGASPSTAVVRAKQKKNVSAENARVRRTATPLRDDIGGAKGPTTKKKSKSSRHAEKDFSSSSSGVFSSASGTSSSEEEEEEEEEDSSELSDQNRSSGHRKQRDHNGYASRASDADTVGPSHASTSKRGKDPQKGHRGKYGGGDGEAPPLQRRGSAHHHHHYRVHHKTSSSREDSPSHPFTTRTTVSVRVLSSSESDEEEDGSSYSYAYSDDYDEE